jgi:hypothetical protein
MILDLLINQYRFQPSIAQIRLQAFCFQHDFTYQHFWELLKEKKIAIKNGGIRLGKQH